MRKVEILTLVSLLIAWWQQVDESARVIPVYLRRIHKFNTFVDSNNSEIKLNKLIVLNHLKQLSCT
jgi:hypothetical protein